MTYGDGVSDLNITKELEFHRSHGKLATVAAVQPPGRFGALSFGKSDTQVESFIEKPLGDSSFINGGFFVLEPSIFDFIEGDESIWEQEPMKTLAAEKNMMAFKHHGYWHAMDTLRDRKHLEELWASGRAPWRVWDRG
jgi:glucose-1-phosphate cytidylyltransferase